MVLDNTQSDLDLTTKRKTRTLSNRQIVDALGALNVDSMLVRKPVLGYSLEALKGALGGSIGATAAVSGLYSLSTKNHPFKKELLNTLPIPAAVGAGVGIARGLYNANKTRNTYKQVVTNAYDILKERGIIEDTIEQS